MLKPTDLGLAGQERTIRAHRDLVVRKLKALPNKDMSRTCLELLEADPGDIVSVNGLRQTDINEIKNYFAESAGPIWVAKNSLIPKVTYNDKTFFSKSETERLYDFKLIRGTEIILVSNKQATGGTNTLKAGDVIALVNKDPILKKKWTNSKYYKVFDILDKNNVISGPISAIRDVYGSKTSIAKSALNSIIAQMDKNDVIIQSPPPALIQLINSDPATKQRYTETKQVSGTMVNFLFEKILIQESARDEKYHELFVDVTAGNVSFFKFTLDAKGKVYYEVSDPRQSTKKAKLRSKQGVERRSSSGRLKLDKLGFQP
jgi:hypothetical protein